MPELSCHIRALRPTQTGAFLYSVAVPEQVGRSDGPGRNTLDGILSHKDFSQLLIGIQKRIGGTYIIARY